MKPTVAANSDSMQHSTRSTTQPPTAGEPMALPDLDIARVQRWCAARVPEHARHQVRVECQIARPETPHHRRAARSLARGPRPGVDQLPDRPAAIHHRRKVLDPLLARPQPPLPHLRPTRTVEPSRGPAQRARPRPHLHLLGLTNKPGPEAAQLGPATS